MQLEDLLPQFSQHTVMVLGDLIVEKYVWGSVRRMTYEEEAPVVHVEREEYKLGGAANVAHNLRELGAQVYLCGLVGYDEAALAFRQSVRDAGIDPTGIFPAHNRATTSKVRVMSHRHGQQLVQLEYEAPPAATEAELSTLRTYIEASLEDIDCFIICDYERDTFGDVKFVQELVEVAASRGVLTVADARPHQVSLLRGTNLTVLEAADAEQLYHLVFQHHAHNSLEAGQNLVDFLHCDAVVQINEETGLVSVRREGEPVKVPFNHTGRYDSIGVRDSIIATLSLCLVAGAQFPLAMDVAGRAANRVMGKVGTATIRPEELLEP